MIITLHNKLILTLRHFSHTIPHDEKKKKFGHVQGFPAHARF